MPNSIELGDELHCLEGALRKKKKSQKQTRAPEFLFSLDPLAILCLHVTCS